MCLVASPILFTIIGDSNPYVICLGIFLLAFQGGIIYAPLYGTITRLFPPEQRYSGIACSLNIGIALFGGPSSMIALWMVDYFDSIAAPALFLNMTAVIYLVALVYTQKVNLFMLLTSKSYSDGKLTYENGNLDFANAAKQN
jgi:MHS family proline/betaine transporter-like MFS transporter